MRDRLRCVYCDLDGTLVGRGGSLLHDGEGGVSLLGARAAEACLRAGAELVLVSGRRRETVHQPARLLGQGSYVYESGACVVLDGEEHWLTAPYEPRDGRTVWELIDAAGAPALLLAHFAGRLEYHSPWHVGRAVSHLFRGAVDAAEADRVLAEHGHEALRLVDNGAVTDARMAGIERPRAYLLVPRTVSKAAAVAFHRRARGYAEEECIAVGDSREDLGMAAAVGTFWLVANALEQDPHVREAAAGAAVRMTEGRHGAGVYEAVMTELAERRA